MFRKILVANRGEIAVRVIRTCREMGIQTVALYGDSDHKSLHVWMADETVRLQTWHHFMNPEVILQIARENGVDAIHPGYGFLAERADFAHACAAEGITFIGPPADILDIASQKVEALKRAKAAGIEVPHHSETIYGPSDVEAILTQAEKLGYPLVVKSSRGGRGRGARLVWSAQSLARALTRVHAESLVFYGERRIYLERAILPAHQVGVQVIADCDGNLVHLGEREGSLIIGNQKIIEESPAPCLSPAQRERLWQTALRVARLFEYRNVGTVEFLVNGDGSFYFTEMKPRIQIEHPLTEILTGIDLVRQQIREAQGDHLPFDQEAIEIAGWAMQSRISASDPWNHDLPSPGHVSNLRLPGGLGLRVDTYLSCDCDVPAEYDSLIAKLIVSGDDRQACIRRMRQALREFNLTGPVTNLPLIQQLLEQAQFLGGNYSTELLFGARGEEADTEAHFRDLAVIAALVYLRRRQGFHPAAPKRLQSGWHRESRRLPRS